MQTKLQIKKFLLPDDLAITLLPPVLDFVSGLDFLPGLVFDLVSGLDFLPGLVFDFASGLDFPLASELLDRLTKPVLDLDWELFLALTSDFEFVCEGVFDFTLLLASEDVDFASDGVFDFCLLSLDFVGLTPDPSEDLRRLFDPLKLVSLIVFYKENLFTTRKAQIIPLIQLNKENKNTLTN